MVQGKSAAMYLAEKYGLGIGRSIKPRPDHDPAKDRFWGRHEPYAEAFEGVTYDPANPKQVAVVTGALSPPSFDPDAPADNAPPGGWPLLLLVPSGGSMTRTDETDESALDIFAARDVAARFGTHVITIAFPRMRNGWAVDTPAVKHESFIVRVLVPYLRQAYGAGPISLLGIGSGGFGAVSLLLRHPTVFFRAAAFDAPLMRDGFTDHDTKLPDPGMVASFGRDIDVFRNYFDLFHQVIDPRIMAMLGGPHEAVLKASVTPLFPEDGDYYVEPDDEEEEEEAEGEEGEEEDAEAAEAEAQAEEARAGLGLLSAADMQAGEQDEGDVEEEEAEDEDDMERDEDGDPLIDNPYYDFFQRYMANRPAGPGGLAPGAPPADILDDGEGEEVTAEDMRDPVLAELARKRAAARIKRAEDAKAYEELMESLEEEEEELERIRKKMQGSVPRIAIIPCGDLAQGQKANYASNIMFAQTLASFGIPHVCGRIPEPPLLRSWVSADSWLPGVLAFISTGAGEPYSPATHTKPTDVALLTQMKELGIEGSYSAITFSPLLLRRDRLELDAELWDPVRPTGVAAEQRTAELAHNVTWARVAFFWMKLQAMITPVGPPKHYTPLKQSRTDRSGVKNATPRDFGIGDDPWVRSGRGRYLKPFRPRKPRNLEERLRATRKRNHPSMEGFMKTKKAKLMLIFRRFTHKMTTEQLCELGHDIINNIFHVMDQENREALRRGDSEFMQRAAVAAEVEYQVLQDEEEVKRITAKAKAEGRPARFVALEEMASRALARQEELGLGKRLDSDAPQLWEDNELVAQVQRALLNDPAETKRIREQAAREGRLPQIVALEAIAERTREAQRQLEPLDEDEEGEEEEAWDEDELDEELSAEDLAEMEEIEAMELREMMQNGDPMLADLEKEFGVRRRGIKTGEWSDSDASDMEALLDGGEDEETEEDEELIEEEEEEDEESDFDDTTTGDDDDDDDDDGDDEEEEDQPPPPPPPPPRPRRR